MNQYEWPPHCSDVTLIPVEETQLWPRQIPGLPTPREDTSNVYIYNVLVTAHDKDARGIGNLFQRVWRESKDEQNYLTKQSLESESKSKDFPKYYKKIKIKDSASFAVVMARGFTVSRKSYVYLVRRDLKSPALSKKHTLEYVSATELVADTAEEVKPTRVAALPKEFRNKFSIPRRSQRCLRVFVCE